MSKGVSTSLGVRASVPQKWGAQGHGPYIKQHRSETVILKTVWVRQSWSRRTGVAERWGRTRGARSAPPRGDPRLHPG